MPDTIRMRGLQFFVVVGDLPHEREAPQPLEVDVDVRVDLAPAGRSDRLEDSVDYRLLHRAVADAVDADPAPRLLETVAERVAAGLLGLEGVRSVVVRCRKPRSILPGPVGEVEIEIERP
jgi:dihydroneopterin aldolase